MSAAGGSAADGAVPFERRNPAAPEQVVWRGVEDPAEVDRAVARARAAAAAWEAGPEETRLEILRRWQVRSQEAGEEIARCITREVGKTLAESRAEVKLLADKVAITLEEGPRSRVRGFDVAAGPGRSGECRFRPYGVMAVIGPFNFPAHLPNGHWVPALALGNAVIFKPSEKAPGTGELLGRLLRECGVPEGVFQVVQGGARVASRLASHPDLDGILFTGSWPVGRRILEANLDRPGRMVALEMGGSNAALVFPDADRRLAVIECVRAAFATTGQRCTCTRRIVLHPAAAEWFIPAFCRTASTLLVGPPEGPGPAFMGPLVSEESRQAMLAFQTSLAAAGASVLVEGSAMDRPGWFVTPSVVEVKRFTLETDCECFGPLVQLAVAADEEDMIRQANATRFGLAAAVFTRLAACWERCRTRLRCGLVNWNSGTAGASGRLPFGGLGRSGNLRPAGAFSVDYCAVPVGTMIERGGGAAIAVPEGMRVDPIPDPGAA